MLIDSIGVLSKEARKDGKTRPIYLEEDVEMAMTLWDAKNYGESFDIGGINVSFRDAGHILGSAILEITSSGKSDGKPKRNWFLPAIWEILPEPLIRYRQKP